MRPRYRQQIRPGQSGRDVKGTKIAYERIGVPGSGAMAKTKRAGPAWVRTTKTFQRHHGLHADGIYGERTHEQLVAAHRDGHAAFSAYAAWLYRTAAKRKPKKPPAPGGDARTLAREILKAAGEGHFRFDNSYVKYDLQRTADGLPIWSPMGRWIHLDRRPLAAVLWLLQSGYGPIGAFAICSGHHYDGPHGHSGGLAIDISTVRGRSVASSASRAATLEVAEALHSKRPPPLAPWQLICDGYGYIHDAAIAAQSIPPTWFYGPATMAQHRNHIHLGYL